MSTKQRRQKSHDHTIIVSLTFIKDHITWRHENLMSAVSHEYDLPTKLVVPYVTSLTGNATVGLWEMVSVLYPLSDLYIGASWIVLSFSVAI